MPCSMIALALLAFWVASLSNSILLAGAAAADFGCVCAAEGGGEDGGFWDTPGPTAKAEHTRSRIRENCFIPFKGSERVNQNCSVFSGLSVVGIRLLCTI